jgi:cysteinyl-tRNA synthetase
MSMEYLGKSFDLHAGGEDLIFPHHENEIAQSEAQTGCTFARTWMHVRFLLVEGEKMSKSLGNFYTLRDLVLKGHKPSSIRFLLASVPYRKQLNFTFDGLTQAANSVERLRNFKLRLETERFPAGAHSAIAALAEETKARMRRGLEDDLNTAEALGAIFDMVREVNAAADAGQVGTEDIPPLLDALAKFDEIFDVLTDRDAGKIGQIVSWAEAEGKPVSPEARELAKAAGTSDAEVDRLVAEMQMARKSRDFTRSDALRTQLNQAGIVVEITKDGARWRRK